MSADETYTYDQSPAIRPGLAQLGGADFENDSEYPPDLQTMPNADEANQKANNLAGLNRVCNSAALHVSFSAGTPSITSCVAMGSAVLAGSFTVTDNGAGDTSITWTAGTLPSPVLPPMAGVAEDADMCIRAYSITNGVRVKTVARGTGTATDANFVVDIR